MRSCASSKDPRPNFPVPMTALLLSLALLGLGILIGFVLGIHLVLSDVHATVLLWRLRAVAEPMDAEILTACADEIEHAVSTRTVAR